MLMKSYPSKYLSPVSIFLALVAVFVQSTMVDLFRDIPKMLNLVYCVIMIILVFIYMYIEPYFLYSFRRKIPEESKKSEEGKEIENTLNDTTHLVQQNDTNNTTIAESSENEDDNKAISTLTKRELEVLDLIGCGFSNPEIAKALFISEHTVNDYTKKIYKKLDVHSRHAAAQFITNKNKQH